MAKAKKPTKSRKAKVEANGVAKPPITERENLRQTFLPGAEPVIIEEVEDAANEFHSTRIEKRQLNEKFHDVTMKLLDRMREHDLTEYENAEGMIFKINQNQAIKAKKKKKVKHPVTGEVS